MPTVWFTTVRVYQRKWSRDNQPYHLERLYLPHLPRTDAIKHKLRIPYVRLSGLRWPTRLLPLHSVLTFIFHIQFPIFLVPCHSMSYVPHLISCICFTERIIGNSFWIALCATGNPHVPYCNLLSSWAQAKDQWCIQATDSAWNWIALAFAVTAFGWHSRTMMSFARLWRNRLAVDHIWRLPRLWVCRSAQ